MYVTIILFTFRHYISLTKQPIVQGGIIGSSWHTEPFCSFLRFHGILDDHDFIQVFAMRSLIFIFIIFIGNVKHANQVFDARRSVLLLLNTSRMLYFWGNKFFVVFHSWSPLESSGTLGTSSMWSLPFARNAIFLESFGAEEYILSNFTHYYYHQDDHDHVSSGRWLGVFVCEQINVIFLSTLDVGNPLGVVLDIFYRL